MRIKFQDGVIFRNIQQLRVREVNIQIVFGLEFCRISWMEDKVRKRIEDFGKIIIGKMDCEIFGRREENKVKKDL